MTLKPLDLKNEIAVVTGGANGIGKGIVKALLEQEMKVVIADIEQSVLDATVEEFSSFGEVSGFVTDVSDPVSVESLADHVFSTFGPWHAIHGKAMHGKAMHNKAIHG